MHVHVAVLHEGWIRWELSSMLNRILLGKKPCKVSLQYYGPDPEGRPIDSNRNRIARDRPKIADFVLMLDSDVIPPPNVLDLVKLDLDVVGCPSPIWRPPHVVINIKPLNGAETVQVGNDEIVEVEVVGGGAYLIASRVLDALQIPFAYEYGGDGVRISSEDHVFCQRAREAGFRIWAAMGYLLGHIKSVNLVNIPENQSWETKSSET